MNKILSIVVMGCLVIGCVHGKWVKEGGSPEQGEKDLEECQSLGTHFEPRPATLGDKVGVPPDTSTETIAQCMKEKGYRWEAK